jgi:predicted tellurium resistance membrane protein TerC
MDLPIFSITTSIIFILFFYNAFKWLFRVFFVFLVVKGAESLKKGVAEKMDGLKDNLKQEEEPNVHL